MLMGWPTALTSATLTGIMIIVKWPWKRQEEHWSQTIPMFISQVGITDTLTLTIGAGGVIPLSAVLKIIISAFIRRMLRQWIQLQ